MIECIPLLRGPPHQAAYSFGYWKAGIETLANKNILRLGALQGFPKDIGNHKVFETNVAIKRVGFTQN